MTTTADRFVGNRLESHHWTHKCRTVASVSVDVEASAADAAVDDCCHMMVIWSRGPGWAADYGAAAPPAVECVCDSDRPDAAAAAAAGDPAAGPAWSDRPLCCHPSRYRCHCRWNPTPNWSSMHSVHRQFAARKQTLKLAMRHT